MRTLASPIARRGASFGEWTGVFRTDHPLRGWSVRRANNIVSFLCSQLGALCPPSSRLCNQPLLVPFTAARVAPAERTAEKEHGELTFSRKPDHPLDFQARGGLRRSEDWRAPSFPNGDEDCESPSSNPHMEAFLPVFGIRRHRPATSAGGSHSNCKQLLPHSEAV